MMPAVIPQILSVISTNVFTVLTSARVVSDPYYTYFWVSLICFEFLHIYYFRNVSLIHLEMLIMTVKVRTGIQIIITVLVMREMRKWNVLWAIVSQALSMVLILLPSPIYLCACNVTSGLSLQATAAWVSCKSSLFTANQNTETYWVSASLHLVFFSSAVTLIKIKDAKTMIYTVCN